MDVYEKLEELQEKALHDETMKQALLATEQKRNQSLLFVRNARSLVMRSIQWN